MGRTRYGVRGEIKGTAESFYRALSTGNLKSIEALWAAEPYAAVAGPAGQLHQGWAGVCEYWKERVARNADDHVAARISGMVTHAVGDVGWFSGTEHLNIRRDGHESDENLRVTCVLERRGTNWQIVSYHASLPVELPAAS
ncbi:MAG: YybH family protein [Chloroflexota bacterium]